MKIVLQNRMGETITREHRVGYKLVGIRINQMIFESSQELYELTTPEGQRWLKEIAHKVMPYSKTTPIIKDSNWGSDWVDDGV